LIEALKNEIMIGYGCISSTKIRRRDVNAIKNTKAYKELEIEFKNNFLNPENIVVDIITARYRTRKNLGEIRDTFKKRAYPKVDDDFIIEESPIAIGIIVITDILALGTTTNEIIKNYKLLRKENIGILVLENKEDNKSRFSTVDYGGTFKSPSEINQIIEELKNIKKIPTRQGRIRKDLILTPEFKEVYWLYENYFIKEPVALNNCISGEIAKLAFHQLCDMYEGSTEYADDEKIEAERNNLTDKPKRHGVIPKQFSYLVDLKESGTSLEIACKQLELPIMTEISYSRYLLKFKTGKSGMGKATHKYFVSRLNDEIRSNS